MLPDYKPIKKTKRKEIAMKKIWIFALFLMPAMLLAEDKKEQKTDKQPPQFMMMSGWGYNYASQYEGHGFSTNQTFVWVTPNKHWGFGLDFGYSYTEGGYWSPENQSYDPHTGITSTREGVDFSNRENWYYVGPAAYWFIVNNDRHQLHLSISVNFSGSHATNITNYYDLDGNIHDIDIKDPNDFGVGYSASFGYNYKITEHFGIGARAYFCWSNQAFVSGLVNLNFTF